MLSLPPLECLRFFEAAARRESFVRAATELDVTAAAVAYRVKILEDHIGHPLFDRVHRGVVLNPRGKACLADVQRILADIGESMDRCRSDAQVRRLSIAAVESVADRWLMPRLPGFKANQSDVVIELETDILRIDPQRNDHDLWIVWAGETITLNAHHETLFVDTMFPVCSPALLETLGRPRDVLDLHSWPLLYHLGWPSDWSYWFATHGAPSPDLSRASGFRLCSTLVRAAIGGMGAVVGRRTAIADELRQGTLVPLFDHQNEADTSLWLISNPTARRKPEVQAFRKWIIQQAAEERDATELPLRRPAVGSVRIA